MLDKELRGVVLQKYYDRRREGLIALTSNDFDSLLTTEDVIHISEQLSDHHLIEWRTEIEIGGSVIFWRGKINAFGIDVIEKSTEPPFEIKLIDNSISVTHSSNVQVGDHNVIKQGLDLSLKDILELIDNAQASDVEKKEAKSKIADIIKHPLVSASFGAGLSVALRALGM